MPFRTALVSSAVCFLLLQLVACQPDIDKKGNTSIAASEPQVPFDAQKWGVRSGKDYPYREEMLSTLVYTDTLRKMTKDSILDVLGAPDRRNEGHLYYQISQTRLGPLPLRSKYMVIKLSSENSVEWIKIYE